MVSWLFLLVTLVGAWFTFNAYLPVRARGPMIGGSFFAGWLTSELSAHHFAWQLVATVFFVSVGALEAWPGWLGLAITLASWAGLLAMVPASKRTEGIVEDALKRALGPDYREGFDRRVAESMMAPDPPWRLAVPFWLSDPRVKVERNIRYAEGEEELYYLPGNPGRRNRINVAKVSCNGSSSSVQNARPTSIARSGFTGMFCFSWKFPIMYCAGTTPMVAACSYQSAASSRFFAVPIPFV